MKRKNKVITGVTIIAIISLLIIGTSLSFKSSKPIQNNNSQHNNSSLTVKIDEKRMNLEIADTQEERQEGLMYRDNLCDKCGMLFIFDEEKKHDFWMKNTKIPLDIIFINSDKKIVDIIHADPCNVFCESYIPNDEAKYVLEVNKNTFNESIIGESININL